jgi:hypothetical protein
MGEGEILCGAITNAIKARNTDQREGDMGGYLARGRGRRGFTANDTRLVTNICCSGLH